jgi:sirohydrochlorin cobaltochelatase
MKGIVLLAHGSRDPEWTGSFEQVRAAVERRLPQCATALAYLEQSVPDFATAVDQLVARGATLIEVVPLFLGAGGHVRNDVPQLVERAAARHMQVRFLLKPFIGDAQAVLDAIADYAAAKPATPR